MLAGERPTTERLSFNNSRRGVEDFVQSAGLCLPSARALPCVDANDIVTGTTLCKALGIWREGRNAGILLLASRVRWDTGKYEVHGASTKVEQNFTW
jgi:hypothetical protein